MLLMNKLIRFLNILKNYEATNSNKDDDKYYHSYAAGASYLERMEVVGYSESVPTTTIESMQAMYFLSKYCQE